MNQKQKNILKISKKLLELFSFMLLAQTIFLLGSSYGEYKTERQTLQDFIMEPATIEYSSIEEPPQQMKDFYKMVSNIWIILVLNVLTIFIDVKIDPEHSFLNEGILKRLKNRWAEVIEKDGKKDN